MTYLDPAGFITRENDSDMRDAMLTNSICHGSSLGGQRIVYPTKASSILVYGAKANSNLVLMHGYSMFVSFNGCYRN